MARKTILFDLDGTLTDSGEGIINCVILALEHYGLPIPDRSALRVFVGPPLQETFIKFGVPADKTDEALTIFRSRYTTVGKFENYPYPGIRELLEKLKKKDFRLLVATSKPEEMAVEILHKFELAPYFDRICGATMDESRVSKDAVISYLLETESGADHMIMVGDTVFDVIGAAAHHIPTVGVSWGYGNTLDMMQAGATAIADTPQQLLALLDA